MNKKLTKKARKELWDKFASTLTMKEFAEVQVRKTTAEGNAAEIKEAKDHLGRIEAELERLGKLLN